MKLLTILSWLAVAIFRSSFASSAHLPPTVPRGGLSSSSTENGDNALSSRMAEAAVSTYMVASELSRKVRDNVWHPTVQFWKEQEAAALERRLQAKEDRNEESKPPPTANMMVPHHQEPLRERKFSGKGSGHSIKAMLLPTRILRISLTAWVLAEVLERSGILHEETPALLRYQLQRIWDDLQPGVMALRQRVHVAWRRLRETCRDSSKLSFAIGAASGMILSPLIFVAWQPAVAALGAAELNERLKEKGCWNVERISPPMGKGLAFIRKSTRNRLPRGESSRQSFLIASGGSKYPSAKTSSLIRYKREAVPMPSIDHENRHPFLHMLRHGILVGGILGLVVGV